MARAKVWFGRPGAFKWVPAPATGMDAGRSGYSQIIEHENGTASVVRTYQTHRSFAMNFPVQESSDLDIFSQYASGLYGTGPFYWSDPMNYHTNLCPPNWSAPGSLVEQSWRNLHSETPVFSNTAANSYSQPSRTATWTITTAANAVPAQKLVLAIPPTHVLHLGFSGATTGVGVLRVRPINADGTYASTTNLTALSATGSTRLNATFSGASYAAVEIYITRTAATSATVAITSMMAQLWPIGTSPTLTGNFIAGQGTYALEFSDSAMPETYVMANGRTLKGLSTTLVEVS